MEEPSIWEIERERVRALLKHAGLPVFEVTVKSYPDAASLLPEEGGWFPVLRKTGDGLVIVPHGIHPDEFQRVAGVLTEAGYTVAPFPEEHMGWVNVTQAPAP